jgi:DNA polymerase V
MTGENHGAGYAEGRSVNLPGGSDDSCRIAREVVAIAKFLYKPGNRYLKAGVELQDIRPREFWQMDMLNRERASSLMPVIDQINRKHGRSTVILGRQAGKAKFAMKQSSLSKNYLTRWSDIPSVSC